MNHSDTTNTESAIVATLASTTRACLAIVLAVAAAHGAVELVGAL